MHGRFFMSDDAEQVDALIKELLALNHSERTCAFRLLTARRDRTTAVQTTENQTSACTGPHSLRRLKKIIGTPLAL